MYSGALCEDTSATAPGSAFEFPPYTRFNRSPFHSPEDGEEGGRAEGSGGWRGLLKGSLQSGLANDNRIYCLSNRALGGYCEQYPYCKRGIIVVRSGALCEDTSATAPGSEIRLKLVCIGLNRPGSLFDFGDEAEESSCLAATVGTFILLGPSFHVGELDLWQKFIAVNTTTTIA